MIINPFKCENCKKKLNPVTDMLEFDIGKDNLLISFCTNCGEWIKIPDDGDTEKKKILKETKWIEFIDISIEKQKTKRFNVHSKCSQISLGIIKWHPSWRHYCFFPTIDLETVHSDRCLLQIGYFIQKLNGEKNG